MYVFLILPFFCPERLTLMYKFLSNVSLQMSQTKIEQASPVTITKFGIPITSQNLLLQFAFANIPSEEREELLSGRPPSHHVPVKLHLPHLNSVPDLRSRCVSWLIVFLSIFAQSLPSSPQESSRVAVCCWGFFFIAFCL